VEIYVACKLILLDCGVIVCPVRRLSVAFALLVYAAPVPSSKAIGAELTLGNTSEAMPVPSGKAIGDELPLGDASEATAKALSGLMEGDRVRLSIFERVEQDEDQWAKRRRAGRPNQSFFQRQDMSGEFVVQGGGSLPIPLLGNIQVSGRPTDQATDSIAAAFQELIGRSARVTLALLERQPIMVVGEVRQPGNYRFFDGMTLMYAITLSGGLKRDNWATVEVAREMARLEAGRERVKRLAAELQVLRIERAQSSGTTLPSDQQNFDHNMLAEAETSRELVRESLSARGKIFSAAVENATQAIAMANDRTNHAEQVTKIRKERLNSLNQLAERGSVGAPMVLEARAQVAEAEERGLKAAELLSDGKMKLLVAGLELSKFKLESKVELDRAIVTRMQELAEARAGVSAAESVAGVLGVDVNSFNAPQEFEIVRRTKTGWEIISAEPGTTLMPGDTVRPTTARDRSTYSKT
jgi:exopolysaccharide production protein ExoF